MGQKAVNSKNVILGLAGLWVLCVVASVVHAGMTRPVGFGLNVLTTFLLWQIAALILALALVITRFVVGRTVGRGLRILALVPPIITALFWGLVGIRIAIG